MLFSKYNSNIFGEVLRAYSNQTAISIQLLNQAVTLIESNIKHTNDAVKLNLEKLSDISEETDTVTSTNTIFIIVMTLCVLGFFVFKIFCISTHSKKAFVPIMQIKGVD